MNQRLHSLLAEAEAQLAPEDQDDLAAIMERFVAKRVSGPRFTPEEMAYLKQLDAEPFVAASDDEVKALFGRRG